MTAVIGAFSKPTNPTVLLALGITFPNGRRKNSERVSMKEKLEKYPSTDLYRVKDIIGVPHPYCITSRHVAHACDRFSAMLTADAIRSAEKSGARCDICKGKLTYDQHETALLIEVKFDGELKDAPELQEYLLSIKDMCEADGHAGFAFIKG
jgi:hypothetical protein